MENSLVLIGLMGTGKSSIGKCLADRCLADFYDTDQLIENQTGVSINSLFATEGERFFRDLESSTLLKLIENKQGVIATGGGIILSAENRSLIKEGSICILLELDLEALCERLKNDVSRPLLQGKDLMQRLSELKKQREAYYQECAHLRVNVQDKSVDSIVAEIIERLKIKTSLK